MSLSTPATPVAPLYAGFWRRGAACFLDGLLLVIPGVIVNILLSQSPNLGLLVNVAIGCAYYAGFHSSAKQATPGKMAFGVKVTDLAGGRIGVGRAIGRYFATWLSGLIFAIGFLMAAFTQKKRALHDMIVGTLVVNAKADPNEVAAGGGVMPVTAGVWVVVVILLVLPFFGGILAAIAIPAYQDYAVRAKIVEALGAVAPLRDEILAAYAGKQPFRTGPIPATSSSVKSIDVGSNGAIVITLVPGVAGGGAIVYAPTIDSAGTVSWRCSSQKIPPKYLPAACRQ